MTFLTRLAQSLPDTVPFVGPEAITRRSGVPVRARIGANESPFGPSPQVIAAMRATADDVWKYGDPELFDLRAALARHLGIAHENVTVGEGIDGLHCLIARLIIEPGDVAVTSLGAYPTFNYHVTGFGGRVVHVPYEDDREPLEALLDAAIREKAKVIYVSNPDNPMGTWWDAGAIEDLIEDVPENILLLLDEAYCETAPDGTLPPLDTGRPNVIRTRTFSKAYGLAGMRVGYAIGEASLIRAFDKVRNHFGVTRMGQAAALAALGDQHYLRETVARVAASRAEIDRIAAANGFATLPSATNFVAMDCGRDGDYALRLLQALEARGVFVRKPSAPILNRCIRISAGTDADLAILEQELPGAVRAAG
jgi:histidinol-phosphate aminotransferase